MTREELSHQRDLAAYGCMGSMKAVLYAIKTGLITDLKDVVEMVQPHMDEYEKSDKALQECRL